MPLIKQAMSWLILCSTSVLLLSACYQTMNTQCHYSSDCDPTDYCRAGQCIPASKQHKDQKRESSHPDDDNDIVDHDTTNDTLQLPDKPCPDGQPPRPGDLVINEFLVNVPPGPAGDANGDGIRHPHDDEFVELVNISDHQLDLTSLKIQNATTTKFTFPRFCLDPGHAVVVFGGIEYGAALPSGPGFQAMIAHSRFMFNNDQGTIAIRSADNKEILRVDYERSPPQALTLSPQLSGTHYVPHSSLATDSLFSPGTCANNQPISSGCSIEESTESTDTGAPDSYLDL